VRSAIQFTGTAPASQSKVWQVQNWPAEWFTEWTLMSRTPVAPPVPQLALKVEVSRTSSTESSYNLTVTNLTAQPVTFEGRYLVLAGDTDPSRHTLAVKVVELAPVS